MEHSPPIAQINSLLNIILCRCCIIWHVDFRLCFIEWINWFEMRWRLQCILFARLFWFHLFSWLMNEFAGRWHASHFPWKIVQWQTLLVNLNSEIENQIYKNNDNSTIGSRVGIWCIIIWYRNGSVNKKINKKKNCRYHLHARCLHALQTVECTEKKRKNRKLLYFSAKTTRSV